MTLSHPSTSASPTAPDSSPIAPDGAAGTRRAGRRRRDHPDLPAPRGGLWGDIEFRKFWGAQTFASLGEQVGLLALPLVAIALLHASAFQVGILAACGTVPFLILGLPVGVVLERIRRRPVMIATAFGRALAFAVPTVVYLVSGRVSFALLAIVALAAGAMSVVFDIGYQTYTPVVVGVADLHEANAKMEATFSGSQLLGPGMAGALVQAVAAPFALLADALGYLLAGVALVSIRRPEPMPGRVPDRPSSWAAVVEGVRFVVRQPLLRSVAACTASLNFVGAALLTELVVFEVHGLHLSAGSVGVIFLLGNVGVVPGVALIRPMAERLGIGRTIAVSAALAGLAPLFFPLAGGRAAVPILVVGWFLRSVASPVYNSNQVSLRLGITDPSMHGRMTATMKFIVMGAMPIGSFAAGVLGTTLGARPTLWIIAGVGVATSVAALFSPLRTLDVTPAALSPAAIA